MVNARKALIEANPVLAQQFQAQIAAKLAIALDTGTQARRPRMPPSTGSRELAEEVSARAQAAPAAARAERAERSPPSKVVDALAMLAGSQPVSAGTRVRVIQPLLFLVLLALLILQGFKSFYIDAGGAAFGSGGLYDNIPLFLWGLSADVAQRTLQGSSLARWDAPPPAAGPASGTSRPCRTEVRSKPVRSGLPEAAVPTLTTRGLSRDSTSPSSQSTAREPRATRH